MGGHAEERHEDSSVDPGHDLATPQCYWGRGLVWAWPVAEVGIQHLVEGSVIDHLATGREGGERSAQWIESQLFTKQQHSSIDNCCENDFQ